MSTLSKKDKARDYRLRRYYGISLEDYDRIRADQGMACYICLRSEHTFRNSLSVDHCHTTGRVRGLLCPWCNRGLKYFRDDPASLRRAAEHCERDHGFFVPEQFLKGVKKKRRKKKKVINVKNPSNSARQSRSRRLLK